MKAMFGGHLDQALEMFPVFLVLFNIVFDGETEKDQKTARIVRRRAEEKQRAHRHRHFPIRVGKYLLRFEHSLAGHRDDRRKPYVPLAPRPANSEYGEAGYAD